MSLECRGGRLDGGFVLSRRARADGRRRRAAQQAALRFVRDRRNAAIGQNDLHPDAVAAQGIVQPGLAARLRQLPLAMGSLGELLDRLLVEAGAVAHVSSRNTTPRPSSRAAMSAVSL
jgi:hypothetical protein